MNTIKEYLSCKGCLTGVAMCRQSPCIGTPEEMFKIATKYPDRVAASILVQSESTHVIAPVFIEEESRCTFLTSNNECELHDQGLKPMEGRMACCHSSLSGEALQRYVASSWPLILQVALKYSKTPIKVFIEIMNVILKNNPAKNIETNPIS
jgi:hypothetical protein